MKGFECGKSDILSFFLSRAISPLGAVVDDDDEEDDEEEEDSLLLTVSCPAAPFSDTSMSLTVPDADGITGTVEEGRSHDVSSVVEL